MKYPEIMRSQVKGRRWRLSSLNDELEHKDSDSRLKGPKKKKTKLQDNTSGIITKKVVKTTENANKKTKKEVKTQEFANNTKKIRNAKNAKEAGDNIVSKTRHKIKKSKTRK